MYFPYGREIIHVHYATFFREIIGKTMFVSLELFSPCVMNYLHLIRTLEEQFMEGWIGRHLYYEGILSHVGVTNGGGEELQHSPCLLLKEKKHLGRENCNIPN